MTHGFCPPCLLCYYRCTKVNDTSMIRVPSIKPDCKKCVNFIKDRCKLYVTIVPGGTTMATKVEHAREDPYLCGPDGLYFSDKDRQNK
jgi:hypothetical protein